MKTSNRKILTESENIQMKRITYLKSMRKFWKEGRAIVYMDESYAQTIRSRKMSREEKSNVVVDPPISKGDCIITICVDRDEGFTNTDSVIC